MDTATEQKATSRPGRPKRAEVTQTKRRRRKGGTEHKLKIPQEIIDSHPDMEFRWGRGDAARMQRLTKDDDWDQVPGIEPIHGGEAAGGGAYSLHLLMKPKSFMAEDRAEKEAKRKAAEQSRMSAPDAKTATETGAEQYAVPGNKI
jgi:hypothetical protein